MPNKNTFSILPIKQLIGRYIPKSSDRVIVDPFANDSKIGTITNDLNPEYDTDYHLDALDFLKMLDNKSADMILYDPHIHRGKSANAITMSAIMPLGKLHRQAGEANILMK